MQRDLTTGSISRSLLLFALPMMAGNLLQQVYNITDTLIVGRFIGSAALAAVGAAYTLMTFVNSVIIGLCMGCGAVFAVDYGAGRYSLMREKAWMSFFAVMAVTAAIYAVLYSFTDGILTLLRVPSEVYSSMREYVTVVFFGVWFVYIYNFFAYYLRAKGNSAAPLWFLLVSTVLNIVLDVYFVLALGRGIRGAAEATVIAQGVSAVGIALYTLPQDMPKRGERRFSLSALGDIITTSGFTCMQQSVMNFGILMIQGLVNSFGAVTMAAFAAAVKIDTLAYMPAQEFGNAYSMFVSQNHGAGELKRVKDGTKRACVLSAVFCLAASLLVWCMAGTFMEFFVDAADTEIIASGVEYLHIEGAFYVGIGLLFLLYGYFRGVKRAGVSLVLTVISLGTRVLISYSLAPRWGATVIWWSIPVGWFLADISGFALMPRKKL